jgi:hypothetical protein
MARLDTGWRSAAYAWAHSIFKTIPLGCTSGLLTDIGKRRLGFFPVTRRWLWEFHFVYSALGWKSMCCYRHYHCCHGEPRACGHQPPLPSSPTDGKPNNAMRPSRFRHTGKFARLSKLETPASVMAHPLALSKSGLSNLQGPNKCSKSTYQAPKHIRQTRPFRIHFQPLCAETLQRKTSILAKHYAPAFHLPNLVGDLTHSKRVLV